MADSESMAKEVGLSWWKKFSYKLIRFLLSIQSESMAHTWAKLPNSSKINWEHH